MINAAERKALIRQKAKEMHKEQLERMRRSGEEYLANVRAWCEFCGDTAYTWDLHMVKKSPLAMDTAQKFEDQLACKKCIEKHNLELSCSDMAIDFEASRLAVKWIFIRRQ